MRLDSGAPSTTRTGTLRTRATTASRTLSASRPASLGSSSIWTRTWTNSASARRLRSRSSGGSVGLTSWPFCFFWSTRRNLCSVSWPGGSLSVFDLASAGAASPAPLLAGEDAVGRRSSFSSSLSSILPFSLTKMLRVKTWRKVVLGAVLWLKTPTVNSTGVPSVAMGDVGRRSCTDRLGCGVMFSPLGPRRASATSMRLTWAPVAVSCRWPWSAPRRPARSSSRARGSR